MTGTLWMLVANLSALLAAIALSRRFRTGRVAHDAASVLLLRLLVISGITLVTGLCGRLSPAPLGIASLAVLALAAFTNRSSEPGAIASWRESGRVGRAFVIVAALLVVRTGAQIWFFAPYNGDAQAYHLPKVAEWIQSGSISMAHGTDPRAFFPAGFELVETWWCAFLHHDVLIETAGVEFWLLGIAATIALARQLELPRASAALAGVIWALAPAVCLQATGCLNDGPVAAVLVTAFLLAWSRAPTTLLVAALGLGCGIKPTFWFALPAVAWIAWRRRHEPRAATATDRLAPTVLLMGTAALCAIIWPLRNSLHFGHPFPSFREIDRSHSAVQQFGPDLGSMVTNLAEWVRRLNDDGTPVHVLTTQTSGFGVVALAAGWFGLLAMARRRPDVRPLWWAFLGSLGLILIMVRLDPWFARFTLFACAPLAIAAAWISERIAAVRTVVVIGLVFQFLQTMVPYDLPDDGLRRLAETPWRERRIGPSLPVEIASAGAVALLGEGLSHPYTLYGPGFVRRVVPIQAGDANVLAAAARQAGVTVVHVPIDDSRVRAGVEAGILRKISAEFVSIDEP